MTAGQLLCARDATAACFDVRVEHGFTRVGPDMLGC
jgi:hypothetical protein